MNISLPVISIEQNIFEVIINYSDLSVTKKEIELTLGYLNKKIPDHFSETVDEILEQLPRLCKIKAGYRILDFHKSDGRNDGAYIGEIFFGLQKIITGQLKKSEQAAFFVCTIGDEMEQWSKKLLNEGDPMMSYLIDTIASITVESATNLLHDHIGDEMQKLGLNITNRYSPGYCNWSVAEQHILFSFFPKNFCGVSLTDSALMIPIKSVSGIIGIGKEVKYREYLCDSCGIKDCTYRSKRVHKETS
jgi:hypothetical protein